jgi:hypothetical protein
MRRGLSRPASTTLIALNKHRRTSPPLYRIFAGHRFASPQSTCIQSLIAVDRRFSASRMELARKANASVPELQPIPVREFYLTSPEFLLAMHCFAPIFQIWLALNPATQRSIHAAGNPTGAAATRRPYEWKDTDRRR